jgi:nuclear pore complex protein Nup62
MNNTTSTLKTGTTSTNMNTTTSNTLNTTSTNLTNTTLNNTNTTTNTSNNTTSNINTSNNQELKLKNKTLDDIISMWNSNLDTRSNEFKKYSNEIAQKDLQIIENSLKISKLVVELEKLAELETEINSNLDYIEAQQQELDALINQYSLDIPTASTTFDKDREHAYLVSEHLNTCLDDMQQSIQQLMSELNKSTKQSFDNSNTLNSIVDILNSHLTSLEFIEQSSYELDQKLKVVATLQK